MYFERMYDEWLAQASYLLACTSTGEAIVVDPSRNIDGYLARAQSNGFRITAVTETHIHADFLSGVRELSKTTEARLFVSGCGPAEWQYEFRSEPNVVALRDRDSIRVGNVELQAIHTPGHTPEHISFLVTDHSAATQPIGILSGDFVFVGDVGRPDLLEKAANQANTAAQGARTLFQSLRWFKTLPDHLQIWPGHGAGSACGKGLSAMPQSTVGYERRFNWALTIDDQEEFVEQVLSGQPEPPRYFGRMKHLNRAGPAILGRRPSLPVFDLPALRAALAGGALLLDTRPTAEFARGFIEGSLNVPFGKSFTTYAGSVVPYDRDLVLLLANPTAARVSSLVSGCASIGLDRLAGVVGEDVLKPWAESGGSTGTVTSVTASELIANGGNEVVIDVRNGWEWDAGHVPGATLIPLARLADSLDRIPKEKLVVMCQGGSRSAVAASVLKAGGFSVRNLRGGFSEWIAGGGASSSIPEDDKIASK